MRFSTKLLSPKWQVPLFTAIFFAIRLASFLTYRQPIANQIIAAALILCFAYLCLKKFPLAWTALITEFILDGSGHFFEFQGFILRTWFLGIFAAFWLVSKIKETNFPIPKPRQIFIFFILVCSVVLFSSLNGYYNGHATINILQDAILYFFLLLLFPAIDLKSNLRMIFETLAKALAAGSALFSILTLFIYSSGIGCLPDNYYHWFRNVAGGKITDLGNHFYRIVLPEHIFILPIALIVASKLMNTAKDKFLWFYLACSSVILALNFTRIYFIALAVGFLVLNLKNSFAKWLKISLAAGGLVLVLFLSLFFIASRGQSLGIDILIGRANGVMSPTSDTSSAIRMALLPDIISTIKKRPIWGSGLGATVAYTDPLDKKIVTRTQFDWGYLEMIAELGVVGLVIFLAFLALLLRDFTGLVYRPNADVEEIDLQRGLLAGAISFFVVNITTPALFYGFGILYFVLLLAMSQKGALTEKISTPS